MRHSTQKRITQHGVIEVYPAVSKQIVYQVFGLATNESGTFRFAPPQQNSYLRKFMMQSFNYLPEPYILSEDLPHQLLGERLKDWTFRTFDAVSEESISVPVQLTLSVHDTSLSGNVSNHTGYKILESFIYYDSKNAFALGTLQPGQSRHFSLTLDNSSPVPFSIPQLNDLLNLNNLSYANPHFFFGQIEDQAGTLIINGQNRKTNLTQYLAAFIETKDAGPVHGWRPTEPR